MWLMIFASLIALWLYVLTSKRRRYWEEKGVSFIEPVSLVLSLGANILQKKTSTQLTVEAYKNYPDERFVGYYDFLTPMLLIRDPDLIKDIAVKNFETFPDRGNAVAEGLDSLWDRNLAAMKGRERWHRMRSTLSPAFTGSKMKIMFELVKTCTKQLTVNLQNRGIGTVPIDVEDVFNRLSTDIIATTAFGIACNSFEVQEHEFLSMSKETENILNLKSLRFLIIYFCPAFAKFLHIRLYPDQLKAFFLNTIKDTLKLRTENGTVRPDMVHLLMEARKGRLKYEDLSREIPDSYAAAQESEFGKLQNRHKPTLSDEDITAQALLFFFAGSSSVQNLLAFALYELAIEPDVQKKLREDIDSTLKNCNEKLTYETLLKMKYLDMVVSETLRKWPTVPITNRTSAKPFTIESRLPEEKSLKLETGTRIAIPIYAIHRCQDYYSDPDKFDPERFNEENKKNIKPYTYLPFGAGPRNCIGSRFALLQIKLVLAELLSKFEIVPVEKTQIPLQISNSSLFIRPERKLWLGLNPRK